MSTPTVQEGVNRSQESERNRRHTIMNLAVTVCVDLVAGYVAWTLVRPGESLLWPTVLVALGLIQFDGQPASLDHATRRWVLQ